MSKHNDNQLALRFEIRQATRIMGRDVSFLALNDGEFNEHHINAVIGIMDAATNENTRKAYLSDLRHYLEWAKTYRVSPVPATDGTLIFYLTHLYTKGLAYQSIMRRKAAIAWVHQRAKLQAPNSPDLKEFLKGLRRKMEPRPNGKKALTVSLVSRLILVCPDTPKGIRDAAMFAFAFSAGLRRSELVAINVEHIRWLKNGRGLLIIPKSKEDQEGMGEEIEFSGGRHIRTIELIKRWLTVSGITFGPLFRPVLLNGRIIDKRLGDDGYVWAFKKRCEAAGIDPKPYSGHSFRSGFITSALESGASAQEVMATTRHKQSNSLDAYFKPARRKYAGKRFL